MTRLAGHSLMLLALLAAAAAAQAPNPTAPPTTRLTEKELPEYLRKMGFNPRVVTPAVGPAHCVIDVKDGAATVPVEVIIPSGLWLVVPLRELPRAEHIPAEKLLRLLEANGPMAPCFFFYRVGDNRLCLKLEIISGRPSEKDFRGDLQRVLRSARESRDLWSAESWQK